MEPFVGQLTRLCAAHPTRAKWVIVPSHTIGHTLGDRLVLDGTDWANLRFVTPLDIALRMGAPFLVERGIDPSEEGLGPALVMRLLMGLGQGGYFLPLAHQPELARALWSTITELRLAGLTSTDLKPDAFTSAAKHAELQALLRAYEWYLESTNRGDRATVFAEAASHPDWCPIQAQDCWIELPDTIWQPVERALLDTLPGERIAPETIALPGATIPRRLAEAPTMMVQSGAPLAQLLAPPSHHLGIPASQHRFSFFHAGGAEAEIEEVFRRILAAGAALDDVEVCVASPASRPLVWEKCLRYEWPVTMADGIPALMTRPGRALVALTAWIEDDFAAGRLRKMMQSGDLKLDTRRAARLLLKAQCAWGRDTYRLALGRLARGSRVRADRDDVSDEEAAALRRTADECDALAAWINGLIGSIPVSPTPQTPIALQALVECATQFVESYTARTSALDHAAADAISSSLAELRALGDFEAPLSQLLRFLTERVESVAVGGDRPRPGHLFVSNLRRAAFAHRRHFFVIGLEEGRVFPASYEDPILLDDEREATSPALSRATDRVDEAVHAAVSRLAAASATDDVSITFSYSCRDLREFRETYASWLMLQAYRVSSGQPSATYADLRAHMGPPVSCVPASPDRALGASRWWLHGVTRAGAGARDAVLAHYESLGAGARAEAARESTAFTEFDGYVPAAGPALDPCNPDRVVSPTQLEEAASCPFRYFLRRGLRIEAIETGDRDRDVWLNPLLRGSLLHDLYARLMRRCRAEQRSVVPARDRDWMVQQGRQALDELSAEMPPPSIEVRDRETEAFLHDLGIFVDEEAALTRCTPLGFEVAFGRGALDDPDAEPLACADPVTIALGNGMSFRVAGRIDRIDRVSDDPPEFEIVDYKTGGFWKDDWKGTFAGGSRLQHALYGLAATELLKRHHANAKVSRATYYFSSAKGQQTRKPIDAQPIAKVTEVLSDLRDIVSSGLFLHAPEESACKWCDYGHACGQNAHARGESKVADESLDAFRRLRRHD